MRRRVESYEGYRDAHPPEGQEACQFLLATAMHEAGKFELLNVAEVDGWQHYTFSGAGRVFSVVRLEMDKEAQKSAKEGPGDGMQSQEEHHRLL